MEWLYSLPRKLDLSVTLATCTEDLSFIHLFVASLLLSIDLSCVLGNTDDFKIEALELGKLVKLVIEHDDKGFGASWFLDRVEIKNTVDNTSTVFPCQQWLDKKKGDKQIIRELFPLTS